MSGTKDYLHLMLLHCEKVEQKMEGKTISVWGLDENLRDAVCMRLLALSENTKEFFRQQKESGTSLESEYPQIPWKEIIRFREKLAHHYEGIDYDLVWEIVENDLPPLLDTIKKLLKNKK